MMSNRNQIIIESAKRGYIVSELGVVKGLRKNILKLTVAKGYYCFTIRFGLKNKGHGVYVHRLQAYQKFGTKFFEEGIQVRHVNGNSLDNSFENIQIGTHSENMLDIPKEVRIKTSNVAWRKANPRTEKERFEIYKLINNGLSYSQINKRLSVSNGTLSYMKNISKEYRVFSSN